VDMFLNYPVLSVMVSDPSPVVPVYWPRGGINSDHTVYKNHDQWLGLIICEKAPTILYYSGDRSMDMYCYNRYRYILRIIKKIISPEVL
jgi:hypothetical protein